MNTNVRHGFEISMIELAATIQFDRLLPRGSFAIIRANERAAESFRFMLRLTR
jgi:hypothetical protein